LRGRSGKLGPIDPGFRHGLGARQGKCRLEMPDGGFMVTSFLEDVGIAGMTFE
jgi:hypothetical protein